MAIWQEYLTRPMRSIGPPSPMVVHFPQERIRSFAQSSPFANLLICTNVASSESEEEQPHPLVSDLSWGPGGSDRSH